ncbi:hypothetical protein N7467_007447 [Penicillium canescens]|nr:hypothetical protein N7467_007447 [Penicillium canescens]
MDDDQSAPIAQEFLKFYYETFEGDRQNLAPLYRPESKLTLEGAPVKASEIMERIASMPAVKREIVTFTSQESANRTGVLITVHGHLLADDNARMNFIHVFNLLRDAGGSFFVSNEMYQLVYNA